MAKMQNAIRAANSNFSRARTRVDDKIEARREAETALVEYEADPFDLSLSPENIAAYDPTW